ncbi:MAG: carboxypeptidase-like regulatory domain-containing protein [Acidobacteriia bacterium]|nr:carboxypeptidase-like regulatory domain-containing protein [Terriglobia bacterium]
MKRIAGTIVAVGFIVAGLWGQALTSLTGTVSDPSGAVVPGATVSIVNEATNLTRNTTADSVGRYSLLQVEPGTYTVTAKAPGFADVVVSKVRLLVNSPATLPITFEKVGAVTESISVSGEAVQVNTTDASIGNAVGGKVITELPFEGRNVVGLLALQPGVMYLGEPAPGTVGDARSGAVNGGKSDQANVTLDGVDVNDQQNHTAFSSVLRMTLDSVEEFRTVTSNAGADMGRTSGAQITLVTKSGTNRLHGSLYEVNRNTDTAANDFLSNAAGIPRAKLIRNVFGAAVGGPIKKDRLFFFLNYEGRRDRSDQVALRTVPNSDFRNGIFTYSKTDGTIGQLTPAQVTALDPLHIGADPNILALFKSYPQPNDFSQGDGLNTAGFRFNAATPLRWNTYIAKLNYQIDGAGKHQVFFRGNLQNDNFIPNSGGALPQFPGDPASSVFLDNSKGLAVGYTAVLTPAFTSSFRYGYTRQGQEQTGVLTSGFTSIRGLSSRSALSTGLTRITPVHQIGEDLAWSKGAHNVTFGGTAILVGNNRLDFGHSFSNALLNYAVLLDGGKSLLAPDAVNSTNYREQFANLLGLITQITGQYNYDTSGNVLPQGAGIARSFVQRDYEFYGQDSWKIARNFTVTAGLRVAISPPVFESNGIQTSPNVALGDWMRQRGALAAQGQSQAQAGPISLQLLNAAGSRGLYDVQKDLSPRLALAYSPHGGSGLSKLLFGGEGKTSIRAGFGMFYDLFGQGLIRSFDASELGFSTALTPPPAASNPAANALTAPRFVGQFSLPTALLPPAPKGGFPQTYPDIFAVQNSIDQALKSPYTMNLDFSIGREFGHGLFVQGAYVGRLARHSLARADLAEPTNLVDPKSGMTYFQAATLMSNLSRQNNARGVDVSQVKPIPFFENLFPGYAGGGLTATQNIYQNAFQPFVWNETTALQIIDDGPSTGCDPCSILGPNALYSSQFAALSSLTSIGSGDYHAMQWTVRKRFSSGLQFDFNYTFSKSIDLGSFGESFDSGNGSFTGLVQNIWNPGQSRAVSDYDARHVFSAFMVAELPFGKGKTFLKGANSIVNGIVGGWQLSAIWRQSSGLPTAVGNGGNWPTDWQLTPDATSVGPLPVLKTVKNGANGGPNIFADPAAAFNAFGQTLPGQSGNRNSIRGDGFFTIDVGLGKRFTLFTTKDAPRTLQIRAEAFNVTNTVRFDPQSINAQMGDPGTFGNYTGTLGNPRVMQFSARIEF